MNVNATESFRELVKLIEEFGPMFNRDDRHRLVRLEGKMDQILRALTVIGKMEVINMHSTEEIIALANQAKSDTESLQVLVNGLRGQVASLLSGSSVSPTTQAAIDQVFARLSENHTAAMAAINNEGPGIGGASGASGAPATTETSAVASTSGNIDTSVTGPLVNPVEPAATGATGATEAATGATGPVAGDEGASGASGASGAT